MPTDFITHGIGIQERRLDTNFCHMRIHYSADSEKDAEWAKKHSIRYGGMKSPKWRREMEIDYTAVSGQPVFPMLSQSHIKHIELDKNWCVYRVIDHGIRHPTVCLWVAINHAGDRHVFREYYMTDKTVDFNCHEILRRSECSSEAATPKQGSPGVVGTLIDPATRQRIPISGKDKAPVSVLSLYNDSFGFDCELADNSKAGYDTVRDGLLSVLARETIASGHAEGEFAKEYFGEFAMSNAELLAMASRPALTFGLHVPKCFKEMRNLRFKEMTGNYTEKAAPEEIMDFEDDGPDCVRYGMQSKITFRTVRPQRGSYLDIIQRR
ncbi:MAG TPA: hypothetical protein ENI27_08525, partial [bacterium]|nr:hypothetical protein [bacterium]